MQPKSTMRYHFTPVKRTMLKRQEVARVGVRVEGREPLCTVCGDVSGYNHVENILEALQ